MDKGKFVISALPMKHTMIPNADCSNPNFHNYLEAVEVFKIFKNLNFKEAITVRITIKFIN